MLRSRASYVYCTLFRIRDCSRAGNFLENTKSDRTRLRYPIMRQWSKLILLQRKLQIKSRLEKSNEILFIYFLYVFQLSLNIFTRSQWQPRAIFILKVSISWENVWCSKLLPKQRNVSQIIWYLPDCYTKNWSWHIPRCIKINIIKCARKYELDHSFALSSSILSLFFASCQFAPRGAMFCWRTWKLPASGRSVRKTRHPEDFSIYQWKGIYVLVYRYMSHIIYTRRFSPT